MINITIVIGYYFIDTVTGNVHLGTIGILPGNSKGLRATEEYSNTVAWKSKTKSYHSYLIACDPRGRSGL